jgi:hyperosmotically inducible protein
LDNFGKQVEYISMVVERAGFPCKESTVYLHCSGVAIFNVEGIHMKLVCSVLLLNVLAWQVLRAQDSSTVPAGQTNTQQGISPKGIDRITKEVHHELVLLPYYGVFDNLAYRVSPDGTVTLLGQVARPSLKSDAENAVKGIEGVERVDNQIQVLPTSPMDDQIRLATYRAIYGNSALNLYAIRAVPPIHIIVDHGHVTLEGVVARQMDKQIAEVQAKSVPNVFSVTNNLRVEEQGK